MTGGARQHRRPISVEQANLLLQLMLDVCDLLRIEKLNATTNYPKCDGMVEHFKRTLKTMLQTRANQFGTKWDNHLPGVL